MNETRDHRSDGTTPSTVEALRKWFALPEQPRGIGRTLGIKGKSADVGHVELTGHPSADHNNPLGTIHGGYAATMLDGALALAVASVIEPGAGYATSNLNITYLRPITEKSGPLSATGTVVHRSKRSAMAEGRLTDAAGNLCAAAVATFTLFPAG